MVSHDSEGTIDVGNCNDPGCYSRPINYVGGATSKQLAALIDLSTSCRQSIRVSLNYWQIIMMMIFIITIILRAACSTTVLAPRLNSAAFRSRGGTTVTEFSATFGPEATPTTINTPVSAASIRTASIPPKNAIVTQWHLSKSMTTVSKFFFLIFVVN